MGAEIAAKKVFNRGHTADKNSDLERESAMLAQLVHPNILSLIGISESPDGESIIVRRFFSVVVFAGCDAMALQVLEFCGGGDLASYYKAPEFDKVEYCRIILEILSGMCYVHARQIAHRDIKPANVPSSMSIQMVPL